jgi:hypothetical protein
MHTIRCCRVYENNRKYGLTLACVFSIAGIVINPTANTTPNAMNLQAYCSHTYHKIIETKNLKTPKLNGVPYYQGKLCTMKYYRFSRRRKNYLFGLSDYYKSKKKSDYMINTNRSKKLDSGFFQNRVWGALHKAWKGYVIAKNKDEYDKMLHYADIIQNVKTTWDYKLVHFMI